MSIIGKSKKRKEDLSLLTGNGKFVADLCNNSTEIQFIRSPISRGNIVGVNRRQNTELITSRDLVGVNNIMCKLDKFNFIPVSQPILPARKISFVGQPIGAIYETDPTNELKQDFPFFEFETEGGVYTISEALERNAPLVHEHVKENTIVHGKFETEGFNEVFDSGKVKFELEFSSKRQNASPLETRGCAVKFNNSENRVEMYISAQMPHMLRTGICDCLNVPENKLRVICLNVGGAFGQKMALFPEYVLLCWLAFNKKRNFHWIEDRQENFSSSAHSRDQYHKAYASFDLSGKLVALKTNIAANVGAYSNYPVTAGVEPLMALAEYTGPYDISAYASEAKGVLTNTCMMAPYRGVSRPVITAVIERLMDKAAQKLGIDKIEIRKRNLIKKFPYRSPTNLVIDEGSYSETLSLAKDIILKETNSPENKNNVLNKKLVGVGFSVFGERTGYGTSAFAARGMQITPGYENCDLTMDPSGNIIAKVGICAQGQGISTTLSQIIADKLGLEIEHINIIQGDTDNTPYGWGTFASRSIVIAGGACQLSALKLSKKIKKIASFYLQCSEENLFFDRGNVINRKTNSYLSLKTIARKFYHSNHEIKELVGSDLSVSSSYDPDGTFSNACHVVKVEIDQLTGNIKVDKYFVIEDAGKLINPKIVDGQIIGGVIQGIANALFEEIKYDEKGTILTTNYADFKIPTMHETPKITITHLETITENSETGAKGLGEGGLIGAPAAILNAINDALKDYEEEINFFPVHPKDIREVLRKHEQRD